MRGNSVGYRLLKRECVHTEGMWQSSQQKTKIFPFVLNIYSEEIGATL